ncbi:hypothetical protein ACOSQ2_026910 [Xanthoceras sorbifolium]
MSHEPSSEVASGLDLVNSNNNGGGGANHKFSSEVASGSDSVNSNNTRDRDAKGYMASGKDSVGTGSVVHIQEQLDQVRKLFSSLNASMVGAGYVAIKGTFSTL